MQPRKPESFVRGAMILSLATLVSRLLGLLYKPAIARIFAPFDGHAGAVGIGLTQVPVTTYQVILSFTSVGLNVGISKLVAERMALGDTAGARRVFRSSLTIMATLGLIASVGLWFGASWFAQLISPDVLDTVLGFRAMAPALFITSVMAAYRGLFQGFQQMAPNAYSQIIEQVVRVGAGLVLAWSLVRVSVPAGAAGFNFGDVLGALAGLIYMLVLMRRHGQALWATGQEAASAEPRPEPSRLPGGWALLKRIFAVAGPITIIGAVVPLMMMADMFFVFRALAEVGIRGDEAKAQFGLLTNVFMIVNLPAIFTTAIYTSILPAVSGAAARGLWDEARRKAQQAYRFTFLLAMPAQAGLWVLAAGLYSLIYADPAGGPVMASISWAAVPIMVQQTTSGILQGMGKIGLPVRNFVLGALVKVVLTAVWTVSYGIDGAAWATAAGFGLAAILNLIEVERHLGRTLRTRAMLLKPVGAALVMTGTILLAQRYLPENDLITLLLIGVGAGVYGLVILLLGGVTRRDVERVPRLGLPLAAILGRARLLR
ncbi:MAG: putative polysaccharide biosynthesis protein [Bacillota bacterium]